MVSAKQLPLNHIRIRRMLAEDMILLSCRWTTTATNKSIDIKEVAILAMPATTP